MILCTCPGCQTTAGCQCSTGGNERALTPMEKEVLNASLRRSALYIPRKIRERLYPNHAYPVDTCRR
jgi:hypothetical protein